MFQFLFHTFIAQLYVTRKGLDIELVARGYVDAEVLQNVEKILITVTLKALYNIKSVSVCMCADGNFHHTHLKPIVIN